MNVQNTYLDTSALVKRYVIEAGSGEVDSVFRNAEARSSLICLSRWNLGEAASVFNKYQSKNKIDATETMELLLNELGRMRTNGSVSIMEVNEHLISYSIKIVLKYHLYIGDAIQIASAKESHCDRFISGDRDLCEVAEKTGLSSLYIH